MRYKECFLANNFIYKDNDIFIECLLSICDYYEEINKEGIKYTDLFLELRMGFDDTITNYFIVKMIHKCIDEGIIQCYWLDLE